VPDGSAHDGPGQLSIQAAASGQDRHNLDTTDLDGILYRSRLRKRVDCVAICDTTVTAKLTGKVVEMESLDGLSLRSGR
jgi:hypothetical protein